mmetsp:Transcript_21411/g.61984  ORF Transcript_21411/g.61984 Transcript_21411/m.61984 type:complete len:300 (+) Transcript_21411:42-941(+)
MRHHIRSDKQQWLPSRSHTTYLFTRGLRALQIGWCVKNHHRHRAHERRENEACSTTFGPVSLAPAALDGIIQGEGTDVPNDREQQDNSSWTRWQSALQEDEGNQHRSCLVEVASKRCCGRAELDDQECLEDVVRKGQNAGEQDPAEDNRVELPQVLEDGQVRHGGREARSPGGRDRGGEGRADESCKERHRQRHVVRRIQRRQLHARPKNALEDHVEGAAEDRGHYHGHSEVKCRAGCTRRTTALRDHDDACADDPSDHAGPLAGGDVLRLPLYQGLGDSRRQWQAGTDNEIQRQRDQH